MGQGQRRGLLNRDGSPNLDDPKVVEALDFAYSLIQEQGG